MVLHDFMGHVFLWETLHFGVQKFTSPLAKKKNQRKMLPGPTPRHQLVKKTKGSLAPLAPLVLTQQPGLRQPWRSLGRRWRGHQGSTPGGGRAREEGRGWFGWGAQRGSTRRRWMGVGGPGRGGGLAWPGLRDGWEPWGCLEPKPVNQFGGKNKLVTPPLWLDHHEAYLEPGGIDRATDIESCLGPALQAGGPAQGGGFRTQLLSGGGVPT